VMDRGFAGEAQRRALQRGGGHVIIGERLRSAEPAIQEALRRPGRYQRVRDNLEVKQVEVRQGSEVRRFVLVRNPKEAERDRFKREQAIERLQSEIDRVNERRTRAAKSHPKAVCALKAHPTLGRFLLEAPSGELRINRARVKEEERLDGKYLLSTTDPSLSAEDVALGYKQLLEVERAFRTLKSTLELRPLYHRLPDRIRAHVLLCWLALLLVRVAEQESGSTWPAMRDELEEIARVDLNGKDGTLQILSTPTPAQRKILSALKIDAPKRVRSAAPPS